MVEKKFKIATLGCRTNQYESEGYAFQLRNLGYVEAKEGETADICIVNTCTVTESADSHSRHQIRQLAASNPGTKLMVTGCLAERLPEEIGKIAGVTKVVSNMQKENLLEELFPEQDLPEFVINQFSGHTRAFIKVQDGCDAYCTYCIIPYVRGRSRSRTVAEVVKEVGQVVANGYKEVVLTGINIGDYKSELGETLCDLIRAVDGVEGLERVRLSSIAPSEVSEELIDVVLSGKNTCHSLHMVLQSGSNVILKKMNRTYTRQMFLERADHIRSIDPDFTFTTDVIVGFPGETELDFQETLEVMDRVKFAKVHMFPYSERKRTRAALFSHKVPQAVMKERKQRVLRMSEKVAFDLRERYIGRHLRVIVEDGDSGYSDNFLSVLVSGAKRGDLIEVECVANSPEGLIGRKVGCPSKSLSA